MSDSPTLPAVLSALEKYMPFVERKISQLGNKRKALELSKHITKANSYFRSGQYELALEEYRTLIREFPTNLRPRLGEITVLRRTGKSLNALAACGAALEVSKGDTSREARVYHTMGFVSCELFETYKRKSDLNEAISFFDRAKDRQNDQLVLLTIGNIVECCVDGILKAKGTTKSDKKMYQKRATDELRLIRELLTDLSVDRSGLDYVLTMKRNIQQRASSETLTWLAPLLSDLEDRVNKMTIDIASDDQSESSSRSGMRQAMQRLAAALASLAMVSALAGFLIFSDATRADDSFSGEQHGEHVIVEDSSRERAKEVWQGAGLQIFRLNGQADEIELAAAVKDWSVVQIQDYDIDVMTS